MWLLPSERFGIGLPYSQVGRIRMVMRGKPATGSMIRNSCGGLNTRPYCRKRGMKSVIRTLPPFLSVSSVLTIAVLRTYSD
jgi:hypothetical protein